jgi:uncharacterized protein
MPRQEPERTCIVTREVRPPAEMIRFVVGPEETVVPDLKGKLPGRGAWVTATRRAVDEAVRRRLFGRAFKAEVATPSDLGAAIDEALLRDLRQALALANKAGAVVSGFAKVEALLRAEPVAALIHASEAAADGRRKLAAALRGRLQNQAGDPISGLPVIDVLSGSDLDLALGRPNVIHAALVAGAGSDGFLTRWRRLSRFREDSLARSADRPDAGVPEHSGPPQDSI